MKIVGIIAEFNPFHNGHKYIIKKAKELTHCDTAICIMSGNFTQAGNISIMDKFERAKIAINNGFDAVIELPTIYATASSEFFAYGAVNILNSLNCVDYLCFGSETGDTKKLLSIAGKLIKNNDTIWKNITRELKSGVSFAKARENAISSFLDKEEIDISCKSNNILAIEYIKALISINSNIIPLAIKREEKDNIISATNIRELALNNEDTSKYLPGYLLPKNILFNKDLYTIIKYKIIDDGKLKLMNINEVTEGLENKIYSEINNSKSYNEFIQNVKSKRYQLSKIKRIMINIILDISKDNFDLLTNSKNKYAHILALNSNIKRDLLSLLNKKSSIPIITSLNETALENLDNTLKCSLNLDTKATNIYSILNNEKINKDYLNKL